MSVLSFVRDSVMVPLDERGNISSRFPSNSEADVSELQEKVMKKCVLDGTYMVKIFNHSMSPVAKG